MENYTVYYVVLNLETKEKELNFGDFLIKSIKQGTEAVEWM